MNAAIKNHPFPLEYHAEVISGLASRKVAQQGILIAALVSVCGILLFLQAVSRSWRLAFAALLTLPAALAGGVLANFFGNDGVLAFGLLAGCLGISGIVLRNNIMLFNHYQYLEEQRGMRFGPELVARGAQERLSPTLMTALATGLALLPFVLLGNIPGHEIVRPIAIVMLGSLFTSTWLNLFAMPALYLRFGASREADLRFERADQPVVATD